jgi:hypothetical protein
MVHHLRISVIGVILAAIACDGAGEGGGASRSADRSGGVVPVGSWRNNASIAPPDPWCGRSR